MHLISLSLIVVVFSSSLHVCFFSTLFCAYSQLVIIVYIVRECVFGFSNNNNHNHKNRVFLILIFMFYSVFHYTILATVSEINGWVDG